MVVGSHGEQLSCPWRDAAALFFPHLVVLSWPAAAGSHQQPWPSSLGARRRPAPPWPSTPCSFPCRRQTAAHLPPLSLFLPWPNPLLPAVTPRFFQQQAPFLFFPSAAARAPCSDSGHGAMILCAAMSVQKKNSSPGSLTSRARSICAVPTRAVAVVFETAPCSVVDLRRACEPSSKIFGEPLASTPLFLDLKCLIKMFEPLSDVNRS